MEIVNFSGMHFNQISRQDNPAFCESKPLGVMLVRAYNYRKIQNGVSVLGIWLPDNPEDGVTNLGHFFAVKMALLFAKAYKEEYESTH